ncbi:MAG TPA: adenine phosphoribosyltransferase [Acidimicrobiales bacterium]|jgi:adenine phosphoribosyltransferase|nr:adenine phosphoribosyltransferase [Acidimicrobiales bacterium]
MTRDPGWLASHLRDVPDFPQPGIVFKDLTPLLADVDAFRYAVDAIADHAAGLTVDKVVGIEARGFIFAAAVAYRLGAGFVPVRKPGKLPWKTVTETYELEYGTDTLEIHDDGLTAGDAVYVVDDVLATGGTAAATCRLVDRLGGVIAGLAFVVELGFLGGRAKLPEEHDVLALITV